MGVHYFGGTVKSAQAATAADASLSTIARTQAGVQNY